MTDDEVDSKRPTRPRNKADRAALKELHHKAMAYILKEILCEKEDSALGILFEQEGFYSDPLFLLTQLPPRDIDKLSQVHSLDYDLYLRLLWLMDWLRYPVTAEKGSDLIPEDLLKLDGIAFYRYCRSRNSFLHIDSNQGWIP